MDLTTGDETKGFVGHVFNFNDETKAAVFNLFQYSLLAIIPVVLLNKTLNRYVPEADESKSSIEISVEIVIQVLIMFVGLFLIHRVVTYVPTYSLVRYPEFHVVNVVLAVLMIVFSLQTKLGEKVSILAERIVELWEGKSAKKSGGGSGGGNVRVSQPFADNILSGGGGGGGNGTPIGSLPTSSTQSYPDFNQMYSGPAVPLQGAATPGGMEGFQSAAPLPANSVLGSGSFGSW